MVDDGDARDTVNRDCCLLTTKKNLKVLIQPFKIHK